MLTIIEILRSYYRVMVCLILAVFKEHFRQIINGILSLIVDIGKIIIFSF